MEDWRDAVEEWRDALSTMWPDSVVIGPDAMRRVEIQPRHGHKFHLVSSRALLSSRIRLFKYKFANPTNELTKQQISKLKIVTNISSCTVFVHAGP